MTDAALPHDAAALTEHVETRHHARHHAQLSELENDVLFPQFEVRA
jgi:iron-sulfur cluster repair protein YtfE (RIC family)